MFSPASWTSRQTLRATGTPRRRRHSERPHERRPSAHPLGLSASVDSLRIMPECTFATLAEASVDGGALCEDVFAGLPARPALVEDSAAAMRAGVGPVVRDGLDLSGDEPYSFHGRGLLIGCFHEPNVIRTSRPFLRPPFMKRSPSTARLTKPGILFAPPPISFGNCSIAEFCAKSP